MGYLVQYHFLAGVHIAEYLWDFWNWLGNVTIGWACDAETGAGCINETDAAACWVGMTTTLTGWVNVGACVMASTSLALTASEFPCSNLGWYPTFTFLGLESFSIIHLVTRLLLLTGVALGLLANGEGLGLKGYDLWVKGWAMAWHSSM